MCEKHILATETHPFHSTSQRDVRDSAQLETLMNMNECKHKVVKFPFVKALGRPMERNGKSYPTKSTNTMNMSHNPIMTCPLRNHLQSIIQNIFLHTVYYSNNSIHFIPGGGGHSTFKWTGGGVPLGFENLTLSQCARRTKNTPCHNIPYKKLAYLYDTLSYYAHLKQTLS